jgi:hypothetical protein
MPSSSAIALAKEEKIQNIMKKQDPKTSHALKPQKHITIKRRMSILNLVHAWLERRNDFQLADELKSQLELYQSELEDLEIKQFRLRGFNPDGTVISRAQFEEAKKRGKKEELFEKEYAILRQSFLKAQHFAISASTRTPANAPGNETHDKKPA